MRRLSFTVALTALFVVAAPLAAGADPQPNDHNNVVVVDCEDGGPSLLLQFASGSVASFDPSDENKGREYVLVEVNGTVMDSDGTIVDEYAQTWGKRKGYHGDPIVCVGSAEFTFANFGTFIEVFTATLVAKN